MQIYPAFNFRINLVDPLLKNAACHWSHYGYAHLLVLSFEHDPTPTTRLIQMLKDQVVTNLNNIEFPRVYQGAGRAVGGVGSDVGEKAKRADQVSGGGRANALGGAHRETTAGGLNEGALAVADGGAVGQVKNDLGGGATGGRDGSIGQVDGADIVFRIAKRPVELDGVVRDPAGTVGQNGAIRGGQGDAAVAIANQ